MGLDMYLTANKYLSDYDKKESGIAKQIGEILGTDVRVKRVILEVGYWRKANAVHSWFVDAVQDGDDNCQEHEVTKDDLENLAASCKMAIDNPEKAESFMKPKSGFFFGNVEIDEYYFETLRETIKICENAIKMMKDGYYICYQSSW